MTAKPPSEPVAKLRSPTWMMLLRHWWNPPPWRLVGPWCPRCRYVWPDLGLECPGCGAVPSDDPRYPFVPPGGATRLEFHGESWRPTVDAFSAIIYEAARRSGTRILIRPGGAPHTYEAVLVDEHGELASREALARLNPGQGGVKP